LGVARVEPGKDRDEQLATIERGGTTQREGRRGLDRQFVQCSADVDSDPDDDGLGTGLREDARDLAEQRGVRPGAGQQVVRPLQGDAHATHRADRLM